MRGDGVAIQKSHAAKRAQRLADGSFFVALLKRIADFVYRGFSESRIGGFFSKAANFHKYSGDSLIWSAGTGERTRRGKRIKLKIAESFEESAIVGAGSRLLRLIMTATMRSIGALFLTFGLFVALIKVVRFFSAGSSLFTLSSVFALGMILFGVLLCLSKCSLAEAIPQSLLLRALLIRYFGIRKEWFESFEGRESRILPALCIGIIIGFTTLVLPVYLPLLVLLGIVFVFLICKRPEAGMLITLFALPFFPTMALAALSALTIFAYLLKYIRGKRALRFDFVSFFALLFFILMALVACFSPARGDSIKIVMLYGAFMGLAFVIKNSFLTEGLLKKGVYTLLFSASISALVGIYQKVVGVSQSLIWVDQSMFSDISTRVFGTFDNPNVFGEFLIMLLPFALALFLYKRGREKLLPAAAFLLMFASLIFTYSRGAWLAAIFSIALFLMFYSRFFFKLGICGIALLPFLPLVLPDSIVNRFLSIGNLADTSTSYRVSIWTAAVEMIKDFWATGTGIGSESFTLIYPSYALPGAQFALHSHNLYFQLLIEVGVFGFLIFLCCLLFSYRNMFSLVSEDKRDFSRLMIFAGGFGVLAMLIQGFTDNVWYNYRIFLLFWVLIGLMSAVYQYHRQKVGGREC